MLDSCAIFHGKKVSNEHEIYYTVFLCYDEAKKNMSSIVWHFSIGFPIYATLSLASLSFFV